jgi:Fis family transcriptional regulator
MRGKAAARDKIAPAHGNGKGATPTNGTAGTLLHANGKSGAGAPATIQRTLPGKSHGAAPRTAALSTGESLEQSVFRSLEQYFDNLDGAKPHALHEMVLGAIEKPLLQFALHRCAGNQSAAADLLGINRNTLRRKLQDYGLH